MGCEEKRVGKKTGKGQVPDNPLKDSLKLLSLILSDLDFD